MQASEAYNSLSSCHFLETHSFICHNPHGLRKGYSCGTQFTGFIQDVHRSLASKHQTDATFLDFCRPFDRVSHHRRLLKVCINIYTDVFSWITNFLANRSEYRFANDCKSNPITVTFGIPQGSFLGPLLLIIYMNDLVSSPTAPVHLFADDSVIYSWISCPFDSAALQNDLRSPIGPLSGSWLLTRPNSNTFVSLAPFPLYCSHTPLIVLL